MIGLVSIKSRINYLQLLIKEKEKALLKAPPGKMKANPKGAHVYYDYVFQGKRRRLKVGDKSDQRLAHALAQRDYDLKIIKKARKEMSILTRLYRVYATGVVEDLFEQTSQGRQTLITPVRMTDNQYADWWQAQELKKAETPTDVTLFETEQGEKVRSKSEVFIANTLRLRDRKYHYEIAVTVTDHLTGRKRTVYPDFYVLNPRTRKAFYWEHLGKCDDPDYVNRNLNKLIDYRSAGILPGVNLIMTFETKQIPFSPKMADEVISTFLV